MHKTMHSAAAEGDLAAVRTFVAEGEDVEAKDTTGRNALMRAAGNGHFEVVKYLVEQTGMNTEEIDKNGRNALMKAAGYGSLEVVRYFVDLNSNRVAKDRYGRNALMKAAAYGRLKVVKYLVERDSDWQAADNEDETALMKAARRNHLNVVKYLVQKGMNVNARDIKHRNALMKAAARGHLDVVKYLSENGTDREATDIQGDNALMRAAANGHLDVVAYLSKDGANRRVNGNDELVSVVIPQAVALEQSVDGSTEAREPILDVQNQQNHCTHNATDVLYPPIQQSEHSFRYIARQDVEYLDDMPMARGGFGAVYRAMWTHCLVALKELRINTEKEMNSFRTEVKLWATLHHDNIVCLYGANDRVSPYFIVSAFAKKGRLLEYLQIQRQTGRAVVWKKLFQAAAGLQYLHLENIVHGDLKCDNIVVDASDTAMLVDFGLSYFHEGDPCIQMSAINNLGAMQWRAPEFVTGKVIRPTFESDVYSLGMTIIEAVNNDTPPWGRDYSAVGIRHRLEKRDDRVSKPGKMTAAQWALVRSMIAYEPDERPNMVDVLTKLKTFADEERDW